MIEQPRIITRFPQTALVELPEGPIIECHLRRAHKDLVSGDYVTVTQENGSNIITDRLPRRSELCRHTARGKKKIIAANIDQIIIVVAVSPAPDRFIIDKYIVASELMKITPVLLINKIDLVTTDEVSALQKELSVYTAIGYQVLFSSCKQEKGLGQVAAVLRGKTSVLTGQSGVGKSSIIKRLLPDTDIRIGNLSRDGQHGKHTTTGAFLYHVDAGSQIIDSPGIRDFDPGPLTSAELATGFREFHNLEDQCRFHDCRHLDEPGCAVRDAVANGQVDRRRYESYRVLNTSMA
jgi:ribosome biogenesis GTPase